MKNCNNCNAVIEDDAKFCTQCGVKCEVSSHTLLAAEDTTTCQYCGKVCNKSLFCNKCGHKIGDATLLDETLGATSEMVQPNTVQEVQEPEPAPAPAPAPALKLDLPASKEVATEISIEQVPNTVSVQNWKYYVFTLLIIFSVVVLGATALTYWKSSSQEPKQVPIDSEGITKSTSENITKDNEEVINFPEQEIMKPAQEDVSPDKQPTPTDTLNKPLSKNKNLPDKASTQESKKTNSVNASRCSALLQKASTGEPLSAAEQTELVTLCQ